MPPLSLAVARNEGESKPATQAKTDAILAAPRDEALMLLAARRPYELPAAATPTNDLAAFVDAALAEEIELIALGDEVTSALREIL
jgi:hypothetical protein